MPKPRKNQQNATYSAVDDIFKVVFGEYAKPNKERPLQFRPTGLPGSDQFASSIAALAGSPLLQTVEEGKNVLKNTTGDPTLVQFQLDAINDKKYVNYDKNAGRFRVRVKELQNVFTSPDKVLSGIETAIKEEKKWARIAGFAGVVDAAVAAGMAYKAGMTTGDSYRFGQAAFMNYDLDMETEHHRMIAENTIMQSEMEELTAALQATGAYPTQAALLDAVLAQTATSGSIVQDKAARLHAAMIKKNLRGADFTRESTEAGVVLAPDVIEGKRAQGLKYFEDYDRQFTTLHDNLLTEGFSVTEANSIIDNMKREVGQQMGANASGYRMNLFRNSDLKMFFTNNAAEVDRLAQVKSTALMWERIKGSDEYSVEGIRATAGTFRKDYEDAKRAYQTRGGPTAAEQLHLDNLQARIADLDGHIFNEWTKKVDYKGSDEYWRKPIVGFTHAGDQAFSAGAIEKISNIEIFKLEFERDSNPSTAAKALLQMQIDSLQGFASGAKRLPGTERRILTGNVVAAYREFTGSIFTNGFAAGLPLFALGYASPGDVQKVQRSQKRVVNASGVVTGYEGVFGAKDDIRVVLPRDDINHILAIPTTLYYISPASIMKTVLWNGEGWSYMGEMRLRQLQRRLILDNSNPIRLYLRANAGNPLFSSFIDAAGNIDDSALAIRYLEVIDLMRSGGGLAPDVIAFLDKLESKHKSMLKYTERGLKTYKRFRGYYEKNVTKLMGVFGKSGFGQTLKSFLQNRFVNNDKWQAAVVNFFSMGGVGLRQLVRTAVMAGLQTIFAATSGGVLNAIATPIIWLIEWAAMKIAKPAIKLVIWAFAGLCMLMAALVFGLSTFFNTPTVAHTSIVPGQVLACNVGGSGPNGPPGQNAPTPGSPPVEAKCPINPGATCTQGPNGPTSHAAGGTFAIDVGSNAGVWRAPTDGEVIEARTNIPCEINNSGLNRGGQVKFRDESGNIYRLLHGDAVVPLGPVQQGEIVAVMNSALPRSPCWGGPHFHLDVDSGGGWVDALKWYNGLDCRIPACLQ